MPDSNMAQEKPLGEIITDARGTKKNVFAPKTEKKEEPVAPENILKDAVITGASALGGGLMTELFEHTFEAIDDLQHRERVSKEVHSHDRDYKGDKYGEMTYGDLRAAMFGTRDKNELAAMRESERRRFREAASYGVMTGAEGRVTEKLIESTASDYPAFIAKAAKEAEESAEKTFRYRHNPRIRGVVERSVNELTGLVKADLAGELNEEKKSKVLWSPDLEYATLVGSETEAQTKARLDIEKEEKQRKHELELARIAVDTNIDNINQLIKSSRGESVGWNFEVKRVEPVETDHTIFSPRFVEELGLPTILYEIPQQVGQKSIRGYDTATLLTKMFHNGDLLPMLSYQNIMYTLGTEISDADVYRAFEGLHTLKNAVIPLILGRFRTAEGSFASMVGKDGSGGLLNKGEGNVDLREIIPAFKNDIVAKRALAILLAADGVADDGYVVGGIDSKDQELSDTLRPKFRDLMRSNVIKEKRPALNKEPGYSQRECVAYMDNNVASLIAKHLNCDIGKVNLMVMLYTCLCGGPRMIEYREMYQRFPILRETYPSKVDPITNLHKGEVVNAPLLRKLKIADDVKAFNAEKGEYETVAGYGFGYIERQLKSLGVDGLFDALLQLKDGHDVWKYWPATVFDVMKKVEDMQKGEDSFPDGPTRKQEISRLVDPLAAGDPPQIHIKTLEAIKKMPYYSGRGKLSQTGGLGFHPIAAVKEIFSAFGINF